MIFAEESFPITIAQGSTGGPAFSTSIVESANGHEYRNINWKNGRCKYNIASAIKSESELTEVMNFFRSKKGRAIGFRFKDWLDHSAQDEIIAIADGTKTEFQLIKNYGYTAFRKITKPVIGTVKIYVDSTLSSVKVDHKTGIIKFDMAPKKGATIKADFEFDVPVRFDKDEFFASFEDFKSNACPEINLIEIL